MTRTANKIPLNIDGIKDAIEQLRLTDLSYVAFLHSNANSIANMIHNTDLTTGTKRAMLYSLDTKVNYLKTLSLRYFMDDFSIKSFKELPLDVDNLEYANPNAMNTRYKALKAIEKNVLHSRRSDRFYVLREA